MATPSSACPTWLVNLYSAALYLYPKSFRENYREQMLQVFIDRYQGQQKSNPAFFLLDTIGDLGVSMSEEHFSDFFKHGRIRLAIIGLCFALGFLALRPLLTASLTDGFSFVGSVDNKISDRVFQNYAGHSKNIARDLLLSDDPIAVMAGAHLLSEWQSDSFDLSKETSSDLKTPITRTLTKNTGHAIAWLTAYPSCAQNNQACDASKVLNHLKIIAPENGMTWLYHASAALERGDVSAQAIYLSKANGSAFFDDGNNALNARWLYAHAENPYKLPWWSFLASRNLKKLESSIWTFDSYVPGCKEANKSRPDVQKSCREIAKKIAQQAASSLSLKFRAYALAVKLGDSDANAMHTLLLEQQRAYGHYLYAVESKDVRGLAKAYEAERQYDYAVKIAKANKQKKYPAVYEF